MSDPQLDEIIAHLEQFERKLRWRARTRFAVIIITLAFFTGCTVFIPVYMVMHFIARFW